MNIFIEALEKKKKLKEELSNLLSKEERRKAEADWHAKRRPRHCGLTIHTGIGCPYQCTYCYIYSMGFPQKISKYPLTPISIIYSILSNPYFVPGPNGTFLALGSVTEPLHPYTTEYTIELIHLIAKYLGNPTQLSTKSTITPETAKKMKKTNPQISILYTFTTLKLPHLIEPYAPKPEERLKTIENLTNEKLHTTLFIRPIIPGITDKENQEILKTAKTHGAHQVIYGSLRINKQIIENIKKTLTPKQLSKIMERVRDKIDSRQRYIYTTDIKNKLIQEAKELGYKIFPSACAANIDSTNQACNMCNYGPCGDPKKLPPITESDIKEFLNTLSIKPPKINIAITNKEIKILNTSIIKKYPEIKELIKTLSRRKLFIQL